MRVVKYFCYEVPFLQSKLGRFFFTRKSDHHDRTELSELRKKELRGISRIQFLTSGKYDPLILLYECDSMHIL